ncbi:hypothetical protein [Dyadobacter sp. CY312]|uniref:hypothetical protein n=1 Tax=Dyadobacter sp. CY312 TaxID=2907303 RepID=UPI001F47711E|nr:hypothetical protein [Dyadobacter sp. CY312]MCE7044159.1 hypothetical protein [Dyadobacter sp. CY312]
MFPYHLPEKRFLIFLLAYTVILAISFQITQSVVFTKYSSLTWTVLFDLTIIPFGLFYYLIGKPLSLSGLRLILVLSLILRIAFFITPSQLSFWPVLLILLESIVLSTVLVRIRYLTRTFKQFRIYQDFETALTTTFQNIFGSKVTPFICSEILIVYYGLLGFTLKNDICVHRKAVTTHKKSAQTAIMFAIILIGIIETWAVHLMLTKWSTMVSYIVSGISLYGLLFILAELFAGIKRPSYLTNDKFQIRLGMRWRASIPFSLIDDVSFVRQSPKKGKDALNASLLVTPNILIAFKTPTKIDGPYGIQRTVLKLSLFVDEPGKFIEAIKETGPTNF